MSTPPPSITVGVQIGAVYYLNEDAKLTQLFKADSALRKMLFDERHARLVTLTHSYLLIQHAVDLKGQARELNRVCVTPSLFPPFAHQSLTLC